ncbi:Thioredoxin domain-containing protein 12 [Lamellibrachia satsuma]|nr:Thioredoxin domain-containing protein 12 [Lamellibrachia satsuma]
MLHISSSFSNDLAHGFNDNINWVTLDDGLKAAKEENKPLMLLIHKSWCGACKALKPQFATSVKIEDLSKKFVMVNVMDDEEPNDIKYKPDGGYIPRILFLTHNGEIQTDIYNEKGSAQYKYYYSSVDPITTSMETALERHTSKRAFEEL